jgi:hypothetical protein
MKTRTRGFLSVTALSVFILLLSACSKNDDPAPPAGDNTVNYSGSFVKSADNVTTSATGNMTATFNTQTRELSFTFNWQGLGGTAEDIHIHDDGPIIIPIEEFPHETGGSVSGKATLTAQQAADLAAGKLYGQIHTAQYPGGEIKAFLTKAGGGNGGGNGGGGGDPY